MKAKLNRRILAGVLACLMMFALILMLAGCNYQPIDVKYNFDKAMIQLPDGSVISGKLDSWRDFEDGDQLQVKIEGSTYLVHSVNCALYD